LSSPGTACLNVEIAEVLAKVATRRSRNQRSADSLVRANRGATIAARRSRRSRNRIVLALVLVLDCSVFDYEDEDDDEDEKIPSQLASNFDLGSAEKLHLCVVSKSFPG